MESLSLQRVQLFLVNYGTEMKNNIIRFYLILFVSWPLCLSSAGAGAVALSAANASRLERVAAEPRRSSEHNHFPQCFAL